MRRDILAERDGPTLVHVIQAMHRRSITLPRRSMLRPGREFLEARYERFRKAAG